MSKSLKRVRAALEAAGLNIDIIEMSDGTRTAEDAAAAAGCALDQIVKSMMFQGADGQAVLFLTAGGNQVDIQKASQVAGQALTRADAALVRAQTGFAIGGVAPVGHLTPCKAFLDSRLLDFAQVWAAAGTPRHIFAADPKEIQTLSNAQVADFTS
ncbi:MAG TPA: YbaK/EbsC family protein [Aliiroseovarius sp.]|nr:YbaK/EbsC family protein [Aliiroseovarius sp.]